MYETYLHINHDLIRRVRFSVITQLTIMQECPLGICYLYIIVSQWTVGNDTTDTAKYVLMTYMVSWGKLIMNSRDYMNPLHFDAVDRYLRRMGDKAIPDEASPNLESFYPPWVAGIDISRSRCCGFFVSFTNTHK